MKQPSQPRPLGLNIHRQIVGIGPGHIEALKQRLLEDHHSEESFNVNIFHPLHLMRATIIDRREVRRLQEHSGVRLTRARMKQMGHYVMNRLPSATDEPIRGVPTLPTRIHTYPGIDNLTLSIAANGQTPQVAAERTQAQATVCDFLELDPDQLPSDIWFDNSEYRVTAIDFARSSRKLAHANALRSLDHLLSAGREQPFPELVSLQPAAGIILE